MKSVTKLKDEARKHEQKEEWEKAIQAYLQVLKTGEEGEGELDLPLYNRVGDLYLRLSKPNDAVRYYVQAADRYADAGLFNNAIALCNKAMRYVPAQLDLLRKLGQFSASQGFLTDARRYFLEYAEKKFAGGQVDEALTALEEFAEASDDAEVREMLARRLHSHARTDEAVTQLRKAHATRMKNGDQSGADAVAAEIETIAPGSFAPPAAPSHAAPAPSAPPARTDDEDYGFTIETPAAPEADTSLAGFESTHYEAAPPEDAGDFQLQGFETIHAEPEVEDDTQSFQLPDFETTAHEGAISSEDLGLESTIFEAPADVDAEALPGLEFDESSFGPAADAEAEEASFDLPLLEADDGATGFAIDGESEEGSFELPTFEIEAPVEEDNAGVSFDLPGFDIAPGEDVASEDAEGDGDFALPTLEAGDEDSHDLGGVDFGDLSLPTLRDEGDTDAEGAGFDLPLLGHEDEEAAAAEDYDDFGEFRERGPVEAEASLPAEAPEPEFVGTEFAETGVAEDGVGPDAVASGDEVEAALLGTDEATELDAAAESELIENIIAEAEAEAGESSGGGWDPSALGFDTALPAPPPPPAAAGGNKAKDGSDYIDLAAFLTEDDEEEAGTRFRVQEKAPTGDEDRDFAELLSQFKQKVSENVSAEDSAAHYDLGLAFKEMGLVDEAISEFQIAMRAGDMRLRVYEELGQCFLLKGQFNIAEKVLKRALEMQHGDELEMIGVYYHLGRAYEGLDDRAAAKDAYERVLGLDINFQDVALRLKRL